MATKEVFVFSFFFTFQSRALLNIAYMSVVSHRDPPSKVFHLHQSRRSDHLTADELRVLWGSVSSIKRRNVSTTRIINIDDQTNDLFSSDLLQLQHLLHLLRHVRCQAHGGFAPYVNIYIQIFSDTVSSINF